MDNGLCQRNDATEISRQRQNPTRLSKCGSDSSRCRSDSKPVAERYLEHIKKFLTRIKGPADEQLLEQKMLEENEAR